MGHIIVRKMVGICFDYMLKSWDIILFQHCRPLALVVKFLAIIYMSENHILFIIIDSVDLLSYNNNV